MPDGQTQARSATLQLGALAGLVSGIAVLLSVLPVSVPSQRALAEQNSRFAAVVLDATLSKPVAEQPLYLSHIREVEGAVRVGSNGEVAWQVGAALPLRDACQADVGDSPPGQACAELDDGIAMLQTRLSPDTVGYDGVVGFALSALVGVITAMGVIIILRPVSQMREALDRVRTGERGVRVQATGMAELDELVAGINEAAIAMEAREDAVVARIQVVQQLARLVAHEVRNPLQTLELLTQLMVEEEDESERGEIGHSIRAEINALNAVVQRLLSKEATSGSLRLRRQQQPIEPLLKRVVSLRSTDALARGATLELGDVCAAQVAIDAALLGRSIENLVINALHMVPKDYGLVRVSAHVDEDQLVIVVDDNGSGVDPEVGARIFEANVTTKATGTGLGLTLVRGVLEAHGGKVSYTDSPLGGARFLLHLPLTEETGAAASHPDR